MEQSTKSNQSIHQFKKERIDGIDLSCVDCGMVYFFFPSPTALPSSLSLFDGRSKPNKREEKEDKLKKRDLLVMAGAQPSPAEDNSFHSFHERVPFLSSLGIQQLRREEEVKLS